MTSAPKSPGTKPSKPSANADEPHSTVRAVPLELTKEESSVEVEFDATIPGHIETDATGKNILLRDNDVTDDTSELKLLDESSYENSGSDEFDPYNSGSFDMSKSRAWKSRSRK